MIGEKSKKMWQCDREPRFAASDSTGSNAQEPEFANSQSRPILRTGTCLNLSDKWTFSRNAISKLAQWWALPRSSGVGAAMVI